MSSRARGFQHERDLAWRLWEHGFAVIRAPASGSRTRRLAYPDIVGIYKGKVIACEVKTTRKPRLIYLRKDQVDKLKEFARRAGGEAYIAVKHIGSGTWVFVPIDSLEETTGGRYKVTKELIARGIRLEALISMIKGVKRLIEFRGDQRTSP